MTYVNHESHQFSSLLYIYCKTNNVSFFIFDIFRYLKINFYGIKYIIYSLNDFKCIYIFMTATLCVIYDSLW